VNKYLYIVFALILLSFLPIPAYADVVYGNDFAEANSDKTVRISGWGIFMVNSPTGSIITRERPDPGSGELTEYRNGQKIFIWATYANYGVCWGIEELNHSGRIPGWVLMDELLILYDRRDFELENKEKIYPYTGDLSVVKTAKEVVVWEWPGSDREKRVVNAEYLFVEDREGFWRIGGAYKDEEGREWVNIYSYSYWSRVLIEGWICLSDPENRDIPAFNPSPKPKKWDEPCGPSQAQVFMSCHTSPGGAKAWWHIFLLVGVFAAVWVGMRRRSRNCQ